MDTATIQPFSVRGKRAIITGGGSGINLALSTLLLSRGCHVLIADLALRPEAQKLVDEHSGKSDRSTPRAVFQQTDVTDWKQLERMFERCIAEFGGVDIVGPGAGVFEEPWSNFWYPPGSAESRDATDGGRYKMMDINVTHPIRATQMAIAHFLNPRDAADRASPSNPKRIVLTSSIAAQVHGLATPLYHASKHAISGFARSLGPLESTVGIRVNAVAPGVVKTPLWVERPEKLKMLDESTDKWILPEQVAEAMVKLMEDEELGGGTVLEVGASAQRVVPAFMNPGPSGDGMSVSGIPKAREEVFELLKRPGWGMS